MKSIHVFPPAAAFCVAVLFTLMAPAPASAGAFTASVFRNAQPVTPSQVVLYASVDPKPGSLAGHVATFEADVINASLDGKPLVVDVDECQDGSVGILLVINDPSVPVPASASQCRRRRLPVVIVIRRSSTLAIDVGRGTVVDTSNGVSSNDTGSSRRRPGIGVYGVASGGLGTFNLVSDTRSRIGGRYTSTSVPYDRFTVDVDDSGLGLAFGGGVNLPLGGSNVGLRIGFIRENERDVPELFTEGERAVGGLRFQQQGVADGDTWTFHLGPTLALRRGFIVSGGLAFTVWDLVLTQTGQLEAGCPTICRVVITDNNTDRSSGSDFGIQVGADYYPGDGWLGMQLLYRVTTFRDAYDPSRPLGYRPDWRDSNVSIGGVVRMGRR
jgi:hypothetical protein